MLIKDSIVEPTRSTSSSVSEILTFLDLLHPEGDEFPVAILRLPFTGKMSGEWFSNHHAAAEYAAQQDETGRFRAIYTNLNRLRPGPAPDCGVPSKDEIACYTNLLLDFDRDGKDETNASEEDLAATAQLRDLVRVHVIAEFGDYRTLDTLTGNGYGMIARLPNLPVNFSGAVGQFLETLGAKFNSQIPGVKVDTGVGNAARLTRLCGTWNRKYPETPGRPHRRATLLPSSSEMRITWEPSIFGVTGGTETAQVKSEPAGLRLRADVDFEKELEKSGLRFIRRSGGGDVCFDYHNVKSRQGCLVKGDLHRNNLENYQCCSFVLTKDHSVYHACFSSGCKSQKNKTRRALAALKMDHVLEPVSFKLTESGNAERLVAEHGENFRYLYDREVWMHWDGARWAEDQTGEIQRAAKATFRRMAKDAVNLTDADAAKALFNWAKKSESRRGRENAVALARAEPGIPALFTALDTDNLLFNVKNGTIDLRNGEIRPPDRADLISRLCPVEYDPAARCPRWEQFLSEILPPNVVSFLQTAVGYSLSGETLEKYLFLLIGEKGDNGKTTLIETLRRMFGDYAVNMSFNTLLPHDDNGPRGDIARLAGGRFVSACESNEGQRLSTSTIKLLVGGDDTITGRRLYEHEIEFKPTHKIWLATNHQPSVPPGDEATWNRVLKIPFLISIPKEKQDKNLRDTFKKELPGILNWALVGWRRYRADGRLIVPDEITGATRKYRDSQDVVKTWIDSELSDYVEAQNGNMVENKEFETVGKNLYDKFVEYSQATSGRGKGTRTLSDIKFYQALDRLGYPSKRGNAGKIVYGLGFKGQAGPARQQKMDYNSPDQGVPYTDEGDPPF